MKDNDTYIRGRRMTDDESIAMMFPDIPMMTDSEIDEVLDKFNAVPLINPIPIREITKMMKTIK